MAARRTHVVLAHDLVSEIDRLVGKRQRSEFLAEAAARELLRQKQLRALHQARGAWAVRAGGDPGGTSALFVRKLRAENEQRLRRLRRRT